MFETIKSKGFIPIWYILNGFGLKIKFFSYMTLIYVF